MNNPDSDFNSNPTKIPITAWFGIIVSLVVSLTTFAFATGIQAQRIVVLENRVEQQQQSVIQTPAILNELENINRRLVEMNNLIDKLSSRR